MAATVKRDTKNNARINLLYKPNTLKETKKTIK